ncbi:hypothetical protein GGI1_05930, partial [Acidithiobacillus sp. GGI-221]
MSIADAVAEARSLGVRTDIVSIGG